MTICGRYSCPGGGIRTPEGLRREIYSLVQLATLSPLVYVIIITQHMKIGFFETEDWALEIVKKQFPDAFITSEKLLPENVKKYADLDIVSSFIYSQLNKSTLLQFKNLSFITTRSTGFDHIDLEFCDNKGIAVSNVPRYGDRTVAEFTFALILTLTRKIYTAVTRTKSGSFENQDLMGMDIHGKTIGIIGFGQIGREVAKIAQGLEMNILVYNRSHYPALEDKYSCTFVDLNFLLSRSDIISLHLPLTKETEHIINKENIVFCKPGSYLVNTARGGLIETEAILLGLKKNILAGVGLDVLEEEQDLKEEAELISSEFRKKTDYKTLMLDHILVNHPKVIVTPHNAFNSQEARINILNTTFDNIHAFIQKVPQNIVRR